MLFFLILIAGLSVCSVKGCKDEEDNCISYEQCSIRHLRNMASAPRCFSPRGSVCCPEKLLPHEDCGEISVPRIINGNTTIPGELPWMVLLGYKRRNPTSQETEFLCGGTLISKRYVLTAAHCVRMPGRGPPVIARLGENDLTQDPDCYHNALNDTICADRHIDMEVEESIPHEHYNSTTLKNDIALLRLKKPIETFTDFIKPICLPFERHDINDERRFQVAGWGTTDHDNVVLSKVLLKAKITGVDLLDCSAEHSKTVQPLNETQLCAGDSSGTDSAKGDSGGPLFDLGANADGSVKTYQYGIVSFRRSSSSFHESNIQIPSVYTRVSAFLDWIESQLKF